MKRSALFITLVLFLIVAGCAPARHTHGKKYKSHTKKGKKYDRKQCRNGTCEKRKKHEGRCGDGHHKKWKKHHRKRQDDHFSRKRIKKKLYHLKKKARHHKKMYYRYKKKYKWLKMKHFKHHGRGDHPGKNERHDRKKWMMKLMRMIKYIMKKMDHDKDRAPEHWKNHNHRKRKDPHYRHDRRGHRDRGHWDKEDGHRSKNHRRRHHSTAVW